MKETNNLDEQDNILSNPDLQEALQKNRFFYLMIRTKKYKHLYTKKQAVFSLVISLFITSLMFIICQGNPLGALNLSRELILPLIGGMLTILGLSLSGLAIISATLSENFISKVIKENRLYNVISILYNFYFAGFVIGVSIFCLTISYITTYIPLSFNKVLFLLLTLINAYLVFFSIIYSLMLLGTCIRMFLIKYTIEKINK